MPNKAFRAAAAVTTFLVGLACVWLSGLAAPLEARVAEWLVPTAGLSVPAAPLVGREEADTRAVYEAVLREMFGGGREGRLLVLSPVTADYSARDYGRGTLQGVAEETLSDYEMKNSVPRMLPPLTGLPARRVLLDQEEYRKLFEARDADGWRLFYEKYPGSPGYISFSTPGFDAAGSQALVSVSRTCGWLCGDGWYVLLKKGPGGWAVLKKQMTWVS